MGLICKDCKCLYRTPEELHVHQNLTGHTGHFEQSGDNSGLAFAVGGLIGEGIYKLWKRRKK